MDPKTLKERLHGAAEIALLDVREHGQFGESHLFHAVPLPYSRLELDVGRLVPRPATPVVVCDDGEQGVASRAAARLRELGYGDVQVLDGGTRAWEAAGYRLFAGVNVPSKAFGELVEHACRTPRVGARELAAWRAAGEDLVVLDARPLEEHRRMCIPGSMCVPNAELAYRIGVIAPREDTRIVVHCAGRTRSIVGAQMLIDMGVQNPVFALENGTQGWYLEDFPLEHGSTRRYPEVPFGTDLAQARERAAGLARAHGARFADEAEVNRWLADAARTTYLFDVRTAEEFRAGSAAGAVHAPGGQLIQATDQWVGVRNARIVAIDEERVRAPVVASWLRRMGHEAYALEEGIEAALRALPAPALRLPEPGVIWPGELAADLEARRCAVVDVRAGMAYRKGHIPDSVWSIRPLLARLAPALGHRVTLVADDAGVARLAALELARAGVEELSVLGGGFAEWCRAGGAALATPGTPADADCIDYLFFVHDRHDGNKDAARRYLAWETTLPERLDARERAGYRL